MKCEICGSEMENTIGGCYRCRNCGIGGIDDCVLRVPADKIVKDNTQTIVNKEKDGRIVFNIEDKMGTAKLSGNNSVSLATSCLICNEFVILDDFEIARINYGRDVNPKICDKCKRAIMYIRKETDNMDNYW